ncbi:hypothetical protein [Sinorhizobium medicae]|uniref:hypothetical protein n=1 Tax=Sinorhizobium medicae TaxID=110321 RepID=UPI00164482BF|nr:hypothetical protein [Sinorhizobium medicae]
MNGSYDAESHAVPSILLDLVTVTKENMKDTVVADRFVDPHELCVGEIAPLCTANGIEF